MWFAEWFLNISPLNVKPFNVRFLALPRRPKGKQSPPLLRQKDFQRLSKYL